MFTEGIIRKRRTCLNHKMRMNSHLNSKPSHSHLIHRIVWIFLFFKKLALFFFVCAYMGRSPSPKYSSRHRDYRDLDRPRSRSRSLSPRRRRRDSYSRSPSPRRRRRSRSPYSKRRGPSRYSRSPSPRRAGRSQYSRSPSRRKYSPDRRGKKTNINY